MQDRLYFVVGTNVVVVAGPAQNLWSLLYTNCSIKTQSYDIVMQKIKVTK